MTLTIADLEKRVAATSKSKLEHWIYDTVVQHVLKHPKSGHMSGSKENLNRAQKILMKLITELGGTFLIHKLPMNTYDIISVENQIIGSPKPQLVYIDASEIDSKEIVSWISRNQSFFEELHRKGSGSIVATETLMLAKTYSDANDISFFGDYRLRLEYLH